jgi:hypothetical protein
MTAVHQSLSKLLGVELCTADLWHIPGGDQKDRKSSVGRRRVPSECHIAPGMYRLDRATSGILQAGTPNPIIASMSERICNYRASSYQSAESVIGNYERTGVTPFISIPLSGGYRYAGSQWSRLMWPRDHHNAVPAE